MFALATLLAHLRDVKWVAQQRADRARERARHERRAEAVAAGQRALERREEPEAQALIRERARAPFVGGRCTRWGMGGSPRCEIARESLPELSAS